ncbi:SRPBCC family protein [Streptomyces sp. SID11385]|uniref:SRPBCC family protein n=1 Tax=Streptomyces sp. SID11385 TaxID=2706031 RepID=UPI001EF20429|nr:SRPBCC family protein [Streptomyces sp. SID11385]
MHDTSERHPDIHWPSGFSPADAHSFHRARAVVPGRPERIFAFLTDAADWTSWVPGCGGVSTGSFAQTFEADWAGQHFEVFVGEYEPPTRLGWLWISTSVQLYQAWLFTEVEAGTEIVVENVVRGSAPKAIDTAAPLWARRLDALWHGQLAKISENAARPEAASDASGVRESVSAGDGRSPAGR